jgi:RNA polymerase sigma-70 factor, ECF subfamily
MTDPARKGPGQPLDSPSDADLAVAARQGSPDACTELVRRFERPVYNLVARLVQDPGMAEDLSQEAFLKMFRALDRYDPDQRFSSWLFRIAHNTAIDYLRLRRPLVAAPRLDDEGEEMDPLAGLPDLSGDSPEQALVRRQVAAALDAAIDALRPEYRAVVVLRHHEDLDYDEIAEVMDLPLGTVKTYLHRARRELAARLQQAGLTAETRSGRRP